MPRYLYWLLAALVLAIAFFVLEPLFVSPAARSGVSAGLVGEPAPAFVLRDDRGVPVSVDRYRGRIVVMNLWASWCPPCRAELPDLQRLAQAYVHAGVTVVGVNEGESPQRAAAFANSLGIRFPIWIDTAQRYGRTFAALGLPTSVILDRRGVVVRSFDGPLTLAQMESAVGPFARK